MVNLKEYYTSQAYQTHQYSGIIGNLMKKVIVVWNFQMKKNLTFLK